MKRPAVFSLSVFVVAPLLLVACALVAGTDRSKVSFALQRTLVSRFAEDVRHVSGLWEEAQDPAENVSRNYVHPDAPARASREGWSTLKAQVAEVESHGWIRDPALWARWEAEVSRPLRKVKQGIHRQDDASSLTASEFRQLVAQLEADLRAGRCDQVVARYKAVMTRTNVPPSNPSYQLRVRADDLVTKARVRMEFEKLQLKVTGVILNEEGKSGVLLNGQTYQVGDWINDDLTLHSVDRQKIEFRYKGQNFARPW